MRFLPLSPLELALWRDILLRKVIAVDDGKASVTPLSSLEQHPFLLELTAEIAMESTIHPPGVTEPSYSVRSSVSPRCFERSVLDEEEHLLLGRELWLAALVRTVC